MCFDILIGICFIIIVMKPIVYCDDRSPPVRSVLMLIEELNIDVDIIQIDLFGREHLKEDYLKVTILYFLYFFFFIKWFIV